MTMFAYGLYRFGAFLVQRMSLPTARRIAAVVGRLASVFQRRNRRHLYRNLATAFGDELSPRELRRLRRDIYANFAVFVVDFLRFPRITRESIGGLLTGSSLEGFERLKQMADREGPIISVTAHLGHWELGAAAEALLLGRPLVTLVDVHPSPLVTAFFNERREAKGLSVVPVTAFHKCLRALRNGDVVAIVGDRPVTGQGIEATYFGRTALVPDGHAVLARRFGAKIVPSFLFLNENGLYDLVVDDPISPEITDDVEADVRGAVERVLRVFERHVKAHPEQWYVFRPVWDVRCQARRSRTRARARRARVRAARPSAARA
jgi:KDO2-lipid IV(A) lauroyltransferase